MLCGGGSYSEIITANLFPFHSWDVRTSCTIYTYIHTQWLQITTSKTIISKMHVIKCFNIGLSFWPHGPYWLDHVRHLAIVQRSFDIHSTTYNSAHHKNRMQHIKKRIQRKINFFLLFFFFSRNVFLAALLLGLFKMCMVQSMLVYFYEWKKKPKLKLQKCNKKVFMFCRWLKSKHQFQWWPNVCMLLLKKFLNEKWLCI